MKPKDYALEKLRKMVALLQSGSVRGRYDSDSDKHGVLVEFRSELDAIAFQRSLCDCGMAVASLDEPEEKRITDDHVASVGPFSHDSGGGKRNIRGTNSLT